MEQLTEEVAKDIAAKPEEWMRFLDTASRLYKYTFDEQLLIFAQRPEATAVASMEVWNKRMYRWIRKQGIRRLRKKWHWMWKYRS